MMYGDPVELAPAVDDLHDAFVRVKAQAHVVRLAMCGAQNESDLRAVMSVLAAIEDELRQAEKIIQQ